MLLHPVQFRYQQGRKPHNQIEQCRFPISSILIKKKTEKSGRHGNYAAKSGRPPNSVPQITSNKHTYPKFRASLPDKVRGVRGYMCQRVISMVISDVCESGANYEPRTRPAFQFISSSRGNCATCLIYIAAPRRVHSRRITIIRPFIQGVPCRWAHKV